MKLSLCTASLMHALMLWPIEHCLVPRIRNLMWAWVLRDPYAGFPGCC
ncbi:hypothetical protein HanHA300_Chr00c0151g0719991 [Helianthus annuus]|nr:hypothetical protein HanHA300_Chr00c0151g0719991 [Helianthus annuus]